MARLKELRTKLRSRLPLAGTGVTTRAGSRRGRAAKLEMIAEAAEKAKEVNGDDKNLPRAGPVEEKV